MLIPTPLAMSKRKAVPLRPMLPVITPEYCDRPCATVTEPPRACNGAFADGSDPVAGEISAGYNAWAARE